LPAGLDELTALPTAHSAGKPGHIATLPVTLFPAAPKQGILGPTPSRQVQGL
jgi:hypothetical protein